MKLKDTLRYVYADEFRKTCNIYVVPYNQNYYQIHSLAYGEVNSRREMVLTMRNGLNELCTIG